MITQNDHFDTSAGQIEAFFIQKAVEKWPGSKQRIEQRARETGANIALIKLTGNYYRGYTAKVSLFHADSSQVKTLLSTDGCYIVMFRDNGLSLATFKYDVTINDITYNDFKDMHFIKKRLNGCDGSERMIINNQERAIQMQGSSRYFRFIKDGRRKKAGTGGMTGAIIRFGMAGVTLQEIKDAQLAHLLSEAHEEHLIAP